MPLPQLIDPDSTDICFLSDRWGLDPALGARLVSLAIRLEFPIQIISGLRTPAQQDALRRSGRPTADNDKSTHLECPATGADLRPTIAVTNVVKARLGAEAVRLGMRWGGGSPIDPETGIPSDWNHFDLGPRN